LALGLQSPSFAVVLTAFGLSGLGVAAFHPEAARKAYLASGERRTTGMSLFSVGGGLGFALAPALTTAVVVSWGISGLLGLLAPAAIIAAFLARAIGPAPASPQLLTKGGRHVEGCDDWRAFGILSGATICRSIVFYGLNTFLALYFMTRWNQNAPQANKALVIFLGTSIFGTLLGGWLADRVGRRAVIRSGFSGAVVFLGLFVQTQDQIWALALLIPLAVFIFMPTSVLVVLGQEYLPRRVGMASGVTLGLAVSVGGMCAPFLGRLADWKGLGYVLVLLLAVLLVATFQAFLLPPVRAGLTSELEFSTSPVTADQSE
jgi:FSR family fosmidomycin resistance protein-like MFS transporter